MDSSLFTSLLADYHLSQGATLGEYHGALVPVCFTQPVAEHKAVREASGLSDFSFRGKFAMKGRDHVKFLHRMVSNDIKRLAPGQGTYATLLNPQGHILVDMRLYCAGDRFFVDTDADLRDKALLGLQRYVIGDQVEFEPLDLYVLAFQGPRSRPLLEKTLHVDLPAMQEFDHFATNYAGYPVRVVCASSTGEEGYEVWAGAKGLLAVWGAACGQAPTYGMLPCGTQALETLRIEAGIPRYGQELGEDTIPNEAGLWNALSFTKGCYVGQEIVERARSRGHVNWKLTGLVVESAVPPPPGEKLVREGREIGEVTSSCVSPTLLKTIALAYLRHEVSEPGTKLEFPSGAAAEVVALPFYQHAPIPAAA
ncbi:MAG: aminomethyltransferase family protein [Terriglobia bacterium]